MKHFNPKRSSAGQTFAAWCATSAKACVLPLNLDAEIVDWIITVMQSGGAMHGVENITGLERTLKLRRTKLRFPSSLQWDKALLTARVLFRAYERGGES